MRAIVTLSLLLMSAPAVAAECVQVTLKDLNGLPLATETPLVGFILPGVGPVVDYALPAGATVESGAKVSCPADLLAVMNEMFDANCVTDEGRKSIGAENKASDETVNQRCKDLYAALKGG